MVHLLSILQGKPKSIRECLDAVFPAVPYCIDLIGGSFMEANEEIIKIFRPKSKVTYIRGILFNMNIPFIESKN